MTCLKSYVPKGDKTASDKHWARGRASIAVRAVFWDLFPQEAAVTSRSPYKMHRFTLWILSYQATWWDEKKHRKETLLDYHSLQGRERTVSRLSRTVSQLQVWDWLPSANYQLKKKKCFLFSQCCLVKLYLHFRATHGHWHFLFAPQTAILGCQNQTAASLEPLWSP